MQQPLTTLMRTMVIEHRYRMGHSIRVLNLKKEVSFNSNLSSTSWTVEAKAFYREAFTTHLDPKSKMRYRRRKYKTVFLVQGKSESSKITRPILWMICLLGSFLCNPKILHSLALNNKSVLSLLKRLIRDTKGKVACLKIKWQMVVSTRIILIRSPVPYCHSSFIKKILLKRALPWSKHRHSLLVIMKRPIIPWFIT